MSVVASVEKDYNYFTNEMGRTVSTFNAGTGKTFADLGCTIVPLLRFGITATIGGFSMMTSLFLKSAPSPVACKALLITTLVLCSLNMIASVCFCRNILNKEKEYLLANQKQNSTEFEGPKCSEGCAFLIYPLIATAVIWLYVHEMSQI